MGSFSIDMDDPREAWEALFREIEEEACAEAPASTRVAVTALDRTASFPGEDLVGWLWLMHGCWADDVS